MHGVSPAPPAWDFVFCINLPAMIALEKEESFSLWL